jgi:hypothetical protein
MGLGLPVKEVDALQFATTGFGTTEKASKKGLYPCLGKHELQNGRLGYRVKSSNLILGTVMNLNITDPLVHFVLQSPGNSKIVEVDSPCGTYPAREGQGVEGTNFGPLSCSGQGG